MLGPDPRYNVYEMFDRLHEQRIGLSLNGGFFEGRITHILLYLCYITC